LGRAITKPFVESNATVISSYVNDREIYQVKTEIKSATVRLTKADITKEGKVDE
jgi:NADP-dependent 3-hydroxy acid dehydrogenase YdfG